MPSFTFTSPDGKNYTVEGPDGATKEQAFAQLQGSLKGGTAKADGLPPAPEPPSPKGDLGASISAAGHDVLGGLELAGSGIANIPHGIASSAVDLYRRATGGDVHAPEPPMVSALHVNPGQAGQDLATSISNTRLHGDPEPGADVNEANDFGLHGALKTAVPVAADIANIAGGATAAKSIVGGARNAADSVVNRVVRATPTQAETIASNPAIEQARQAGFKLTGNDVRNAVNGPTPGVEADIPGSTRQNMADQGVTDQIQRHNRALATQSAAEDVGLGNTRAIQDDQIAMGKTKAGTVYDKMGRAIGQRAPEEISPQFNADLGSAGARAASPEGRVAVEKQIGYYRDHFATEGFNGPDAVASARDLRQQAYKQMANPDVDQQVLGKTNLSIANAIENEMQRLLPVQYQGLKIEFPAARQQLAKLHELEEATEGGQVNAQTFKRLRDAGAPLTGAAADIAHAADVAPESMAQAVGPGQLHVPVSHSGTLRTVVNAGARAMRALPGMNPATEAFQEANYGPRGKPAVDIPPPEAAPDLKLQPPPGSLPMRGQNLPLGPAPGGPAHDFALEPPAGNAPAYPIQRDLPLAAREAPADLARAPQKMTAKERAIWERAVMERLGNGQ